MPFAGAPRADDGLVYTVDGRVFDPDGVLTSPVAEFKPRGRTLSLEVVAAEYESRGQRPVIDRTLNLVRVDCPDCKAQETDPLGIWRPLRIVPRPGNTTYICDACGAESIKQIF